MHFYNFLFQETIYQIFLHEIYFILIAYTPVDKNSGLSPTPTKISLTPALYYPDRWWGLRYRICTITPLCGVLPGGLFLRIPSTVRKGGFHRDLSPLV